MPYHDRGRLHLGLLIVKPSEMKVFEETSKTRPSPSPLCKSVDSGYSV